MSASNPRPLIALRWQVVLLVSLATALSYLDRQTLPIAIKAIERDIPIDAQQFANLNTAFLLTYAIMYAVGGRIIDVLGTRLGFLIVMVFWSLACAGHGLATSFAMLAFFRLCLGAGEGGGFPAATRVMAEWVPAKDRTFAMGIINTGSAFGMIVAPFLISRILDHASWPWVFFVAGGLGLIWSVWWFFRYHPPETNARLTEGERGELEILANSYGHPAVPQPWLELLRLRPTWGLLVAKFLSDGAWYFYLFWLPKYLYDARHLNIKEVATFVWMPAVAMAIGSFFGGWFSSWLLHRNYSLNAARKIALAMSALLMPCVLVVTTVPLSWAIVIFCLAYLGHQFWATILMTLPADIFSKNSVGSVAGLMGCAGGLGGVVFGEAMGWLLQHGFGWPLVFTLGGAMHVLSFALLCAFMPRLQPLTPRPVTTT
ncbi:MAG: MFS transporter [Planctomycetota bacterium]|nr:MFS transporter [Planctomycetota bacterium]